MESDGIKLKTSEWVSCVWTRCHAAIPCSGWRWRWRWRWEQQQQSATTTTATQWQHTTSWKKNRSANSLGYDKKGFRVVQYPISNIQYPISNIRTNGKGMHACEGWRRKYYTVYIAWLIGLAWLANTAKLWLLLSPADISKGKLWRKKWTDVVTLQ